ncbi:hypothetical protein GGR54DRAFT_652324 [Hypoxylon sp. NC1633]|nr:hypothetical protein GGR54DRAFT_652324 [Hypoxylon sp. NC1633]
MNRLSMEIHHMIAAGLSDPISLVALCRSSKSFNHMYTYPLYKRYGSLALIESILAGRPNEEMHRKVQSAVYAHADLQIQHRIKRERFCPSPDDSDDIPVVVYLKEEEYDISPLHLAAFKGLEDVMEILLDSIKKAKAPRIYPEGPWTPLFFALCGHQSSAAMRLLKEGDPLLIFGQYCAVQIASAHNLPEVLVHLVKERRMDINRMDVDGFTPLAHAIIFPWLSIDLIALLESLGADLDQMISAGYANESFSPLDYAISHSYWTSAALLLDHFTHSPPREERTLDHDLNTIKLVLPLGPWSMAPERRLVLIKVLKYATRVTTEIMAPIFCEHVQKYQNLEAVELLLAERRVDIELPGVGGLTPLDLALSPNSGSPEIAALLLQHGALISPRATKKILKLANFVCKTDKSFKLHAILQRNHHLAPIFYLLWTHCRVAVMLL